MSNGKIATSEMNRHLWRLLKEYEKDNNCLPIKAIPLAFPIYETTYTIKEKISEPIGFVNRYILKAILDFGPCTIKELNEILCLGESRISFVLNTIMQYNSNVKFINGKYQAETQLLEDLDKGRFTKEVSQERKFLVNSLTGYLIPLNILQENNQLFLKKEGEYNLLINNERKEFIFSCSINHASYDGKDHIEELIKTTDYATKEKYGIPNTAYDVEKMNNTAPFWILSFLIVDELAKISIYSCGRNPVQLELPGNGNCKGYLLNVCPQLKKDQLATNINKDFLLKNFKNVPATVTPTPDKKRFLISVDNPDKNIGFYFDKLPEDNDNNCLWVSTSLENGVMWDALHTWGVLEVLPGDKKTAENICLKKGIKQLQEKLSNIDIADIDVSDFNLNDWWDGFQINFEKELLDLCEFRKIPLKTFADLINLVPDTEFQEKFNKIINLKKTSKATTNIKTDNFGILLINDCNKKKSCIGDSILQCITEAKNEILLISHIIDSQKIVDALLLSHSKGINVKIITPLSDADRKKQIFKFPTHGFEFNEEKQHLKRHFEFVRKLGEKGLLCRTPKYYPHAKLLISDSKAIISSANITENSLGWGKEIALEAGLLIEDSQVLQKFNNIFDDIWQDSPFRQHLESNNITIIEQKEKNKILKYSRQKGKDLLFTISSPPNQFTIYEQLVKLINNAQKQIVLSTFTIYDTKKTEKLHTALLEAKNRGVEIIILIRSEYPKDWPDTSTAELINNGIKILGIEKLHAKGILIDEKECGIFSANLNPYSLYCKEISAHIEIGLFGSVENPIMTSYAKFIKNLLKQGNSIEKN